MTVNARSALAVVTVAVTACAGAEVIDPAHRQGPMVTGAFIQLNQSLARHDLPFWRDELAAMRRIGIDTLIIQFTGHGDRWFYPAPSLPDAAGINDSVGHILIAADDHAMRVFLGLHLDPAFWSGDFDIDQRLEVNKRTLDELHTRYGAHDSLAGWYIPEEISDHTASDPSLSERMIQYVAALASAAHAKTELPVMLSPYFGKRPNPAAYAAWWDRALPRMKIDILALQDGVGTHRTTIEESRPVFEALAPVMAKHNVAFWANNESFDQTHGWPVDDQPWRARPVDPETFLRQVESTAPFVSRTVTFEFPHYISPRLGGRAAALYEACLERHDAHAPPAPLAPAR